MIGMLTVSGVTLAALLFAGITAGATELTITVSGTSSQGKVFGQVFADAATFKARDRAVARFSIEPKGNAARTTVELPPGRYAIAMFQDTKGTGKMETNFLGMPTVPYGFSNNARGSMGPPGFDDAVFAVGTAAAAITIQLR